MKGKVYLVGAGPGDYKLMTLKGMECIKKADVIVYDRLANEKYLKEANENCEFIYVGKASSNHALPQDKINEVITNKAKEGKTVTRLKGGDPYVFGRGGEEVLALVEENIPFEVIPGVTSPISVLNYAGIPITHRGLAQSFHIVTGMSARTLNVNWEALSKENGTLVFMMGLSNLETIVENLLENGKDIETPCGVVMRGTTSKQRKVIGTLENICKKVREAKLESPCIIVVGDVVSLNEKLSWYEKLPLFGANICLTRSKEQSKEIKWKLKELGAEVTEINSIKIKETAHNLDEYINTLEKYDHIVFTSVNAVNVFFDYLVKNQFDIRKIKADFAVLGKATKKALIVRGIVPSIMAHSFTAEGLFEVLKDNIKEGEEVLIPCSSLSREYLFDNLASLGAKCHRVNIYDTVCGDVKNPRAFKEVDMVLYTSPSTVKNMIDMIGLEALKEKVSIAIGPITLKALNESGIEGKMCKTHCGDGFLSEIEGIWQEVKK